MKIITDTLKQILQEIKDPEAVKLTVKAAPMKHCDLATFRKTGTNGSLRERKKDSMLKL